MGGQKKLSPKCDFLPIKKRIIKIGQEMSAPGWSQDGVFSNFRTPVLRHIDANSAKIWDSGITQEGLLAYPISLKSEI